MKPSNKKRTIIIIAIVLVIIALVIIVPKLLPQQSAASMFQTVPFEKGELVAIVGSTGIARGNQSATLTWQTSGVVEKIMTNVNDLVKKDQVLMELDSGSLQQSVLLAQADLVAAKRALADLQNSDLQKATALQNMVNAQKAVDDARTKLASKNYNRASPNAIDEARANLIIAEDMVTKATEAYDQVDSFSDTDPIKAEMFAQLARARQNRDMKLANLNWLLGHPDEQELAGANAELEVALAKLKDATREWERLKNGADSADIEAAEIKVKALEATLELERLTAPFDGTITALSNKIGDLVNPGTAGFRIDDLSRILIDLKIPEVYINEIKNGQDATITFDAIMGKEYKGKVVDVARVGSSESNVVTFRVVIEVVNPDEMLSPGMTAAVNIITTRLEQARIIPNRAVRFVDGKRVIYVLRNNMPVAVPITIGASSDTSSELVEGDIAEGELIILNPPSSGMMGFGY